jgi:hypothetical protein
LQTKYVTCKNSNLLYHNYYAKIYLLLCKCKQGICLEIVTDSESSNSNLKEKVKQVVLRDQENFVNRQCRLPKVDESPMTQNITLF